MSAEQHVWDLVEKGHELNDQLKAAKAQSVPTSPDLEDATNQAQMAKVDRVVTSGHLKDVGTELTQINEGIIDRNQLIARVAETRARLEKHIADRIAEMTGKEKFGRYLDNIKHRRSLTSSEAIVEKFAQEFWAKRATEIGGGLATAERTLVQTNSESIRKEIAELNRHYEELVIEQTRLAHELKKARAAELEASERLDSLLDTDEAGITAQEQKLAALSQQVEELEAQKQAWAEKFKISVAKDLAEIESLTNAKQKKDLEESERKKRLENRMSAADEPSKPESSLEVTAGQQITEAAKVRFDDEGNPRTPEAVVRGLINQMDRALTEYRTIAKVAEEDDINYKLFMDIDSEVTHREMTDLASEKLAELRTQFGAFTAEEMVSARKVEEARLREQFGLNAKFNPDEAGFGPMKRNIFKEQERAEKKVQAGLKKFEAAQAERMAKAEQAFGEWLNSEYVNELHTRALEGLSRFHETVEQTKNLGSLDRRLVTSQDYVQALRNAETIMNELGKWERWMNDPADVINQFAEVEELFMHVEQMDRKAAEGLQQEIQQNEAQIAELQAQIKKVEDRKGWKQETKGKKIRKLQVRVDELTDRNKELNDDVSTLSKMTEDARAIKDARIAEMRKTILPTEFNGKQLFSRPKTNVAKLYAAVMEGVKDTTITRGTTQVKLDKFADQYVGIVPFDTMVQQEVIRLAQERELEEAAINNEIAAERTYAELMHATESSGAQVDDLLMRTDEAVLLEMSPELADQIFDSSLGRLLKNLKTAQATYETTGAGNDKRVVEKRIAVLRILAEVTGNDYLHKVVEEQTKVLVETPVEHVGPAESQAEVPDNPYIRAMTQEPTIESTTTPDEVMTSAQAAEPVVEEPAAAVGDSLEDVIQSLGQ